MVDGRDDTPPRAPRWVVWGAIALGVLLLLGLVAVATGSGGEHGPGRHSSLDAAEIVVALA